MKSTHDLTAGQATEVARLKDIDGRVRDIQAELWGLLACEQTPGVIALANVLSTTLGQVRGQLSDEVRRIYR